MKNLYIHRYTIIITALLFVLSFNSFGQGCVAIRSYSGFGTEAGGGALLPKGTWQPAMNFRYFKSFRHFRGAEEEAYRVEEGSQVINNSYFLDLSLTYGITDRLYTSVILPFVYYDRSSMYEHGGNPKEDDPSTPENEYWPGDRHSTYAQGLADMRVSFGYWLLDPEKHPMTNFSVAFGVKLPTGDANAQSFFYNQGPEKTQVLQGAVDQSIQPGDGGVGVTFELQGYYMLSHNLVASGYFYYLANPRGTYPIDGRRGPSEYSVSDQYAVRLGFNYMLPVEGLSLYLGGRREAIPSNDFLGSSEGRRRPGFVVSIEPGLNYSKGKWSANVSVPVALIRNRTLSYSDKQSGRHGDAAFADYLINAGISYRISPKKSHQDLPVNLEEN